MLELVHRIPQTQASGLVLQKLIDNRSKCYKQLADLSNLKQSGLLSDAEYASEREAIMSTLKPYKILECSNARMAGRSGLQSEEHSTQIWVQLAQHSSL